MVATARLRRTLVALAVLQIGCTSSSSVPLAVPSAELVAQSGVIELQDGNGRRTPVAPDSKLSFTRHDGTATGTFRAANLCRTTTGLAVRTPAGGCSDATPLIAFDDIDSVDVSTWDRAGTTAIIGGSVIVVVGLLVILVASVGSKDKNGDGPFHSSSSSSGHGRSRGAGDARLIAPAIRVGSAMANQAASDAATTAPEPPVGPLFSAGDRRRAKVQILLDTDISASAFAPRDSLATGGRLGVRLSGFFDVSAGVRAFAGDDRPTRAVPVLGVGFHGPLPRAPWFGFAVGGEVGASSAIRFYGTVRVGARIAPFQRFWLTLYPIHPTYTAWTHGFGDRWVPASTFEMSYAF